MKKISRQQYGDRKVLSRSSLCIFLTVPLYRIFQVIKILKQKMKNFSFFEKNISDFNINAVCFMELPIDLQLLLFSLNFSKYEFF